MIQRLFWAAIVAGSIAGAAVSLFHMRAAEPLILEAEKYEQAADHADAGAMVSEGRSNPHQPPTITATILLGIPTTGLSAWLIRRWPTSPPASASA
jgi:predicted cobalt transporter CbtA